MVERRKIIELVDVKKVYRIGNEEYEILKGINFEVYEGDFIAIMGPSGAGKTTLLNILGCLDKPSHGKYFLDGIDVTELNDKELAKVRNRKIGFVFQEFHLIPWATVLENVLLPVVYADGVTKEAVEKAKYFLDRVGLSDRINFKPTELSGGQRQRVAIVRALINDPAIILADEPTGNLDSRSGQEILDIFRSLNSDGRTIIMITHDSNVASMAKIIKYLKDGVFVS